jgi:hypothetical protein
VKKTNTSAPIPLVPGDWGVTTLGDHCRIDNGCPFESVYFNVKGDGIPLILLFEFEMSMRAILRRPIPVITTHGTSYRMAIF